MARVSRNDNTGTVLPSPASHDERRRPHLARGSVTAPRATRRGAAQRRARVASRVLRLVRLDAALVAELQAALPELRRDREELRGPVKKE